MAKIDKYKEISGFLKTGFYLIITTLLAIGAYVFKTYKSLQHDDFVIIYISIIMLIISLLVITHFYIKNLNKLEEIE